MGTLLCAGFARTVTNGRNISVLDTLSAAYASANRYGQAVTTLEMAIQFVFVTRLFLGVMFIWGSLPKIHVPYKFLGDVYAYELVGPSLGVWVAVLLPWLELAVGIALVGGIFVGGALLLSSGMGVMFAGVIAWALYNGLDISCGCFQYQQ